MDPVTIFGVVAVTLMMLMYALEARGRGFILAFALGCLLSSAYGFLSGAWRELVSVADRLGLEPPQASAQPPRIARHG